MENSIEWGMPVRDLSETMRITKISDDEVHLFINVFKEELLLGMTMTQVKLLHELLETFIKTGQPQVSICGPENEK